MLSNDPETKKNKSMCTSNLNNKRNLLVLITSQIFYFLKKMPCLKQRVQLQSEKYQS